MIMSNVNRDNCTALYVFSALTIFFASAGPRKPGDFLLVGDTGIAEWMFLVQGTRSIIEMFPNELFAGKLGPMFSLGKRRDLLRETVSGDNTHLKDLEQYIRGTILDPHASHAYFNAIHELRRSFGVLANSSPEDYDLTDACIWPFHISEEYILLLRQRTQVALVIYAYFCVLLKRADSHWFMHGWSEHLISQIWSTLDAEHRLLIRWPIEEIGFIPA